MALKRPKWKPGTVVVLEHISKILRGNALMTAVTLLESGADVVVLRHPESVKRVKAAIADLMVAA